MWSPNVSDVTCWPRGARLKGLLVDQCIFFLGIAVEILYFFFVADKKNIFLVANIFLKRVLCITKTYLTSGSKDPTLFLFIFHW